MTSLRTQLGTPKACPSAAHDKHFRRSADRLGLVGILLDAVECKRLETVIGTELPKVRWAPIGEIALDASTYVGLHVILAG